jgi:hypothetical protein
MSLYRVLAFSLMLSLFAFVAVAQNQGVPPDSFPASASGAFQVNYIANANVATSAVVISNTGAEGGYDGSNDPQGGPTAARPSGNICANVYVFNACQELVACCSCPVTPNALKYLTTRQLLGNPAHPPLCPGATGPTQPSLSAYSIKVWATLPKNYPTSTPGRIDCDAGRPTGGAGTGWTDALGAPGASAMGLRVWRTTYHNFAPPANNAGLAETQFSPAILGTLERERIVNVCRLYQQNLSGPGICADCVTGAVAPR